VEKLDMDGSGSHGESTPSPWAFGAIKAPDELEKPFVVATPAVAG